jgi:hypothetical protein
MLVAVVMLFVVGAMAALSIDVVTIYTARSEAQLAADGAALAGARLLANSGMTSDPTGALTASAEALASTVANQVAQHNPVGGRNLKAAEVVVSFAGTTTNPLVTVRVQRTDLPTFFARIWGSKQITVGASASAEAYNPSGASASPVAPTCVKPWLLPNMDPSNGSKQIFDPVSGAINPGSNLLNGPEATRLRTDCTNCSAPAPAPTVWRYYPGDPYSSFPPPSPSSVACPGCAGFTNPNYQLSIAGCIQTPISCNSKVNVDVTDVDPTRDTETGTAVNGLTHSTGTGGDSVDSAAVPSPPFQFLAGTENPIVLSGAMAAGTDVMVSDSLVIVPVIDTSPPRILLPTTLPFKSSVFYSSS